MVKEHNEITTAACPPCSTQGTQGFSTPKDQQFLMDPESGAMDEDSRSPAPSPKKRHRPMMESNSQPGMGSSISVSFGSCRWSEVHVLINLPPLQILIPIA